MSYYLWPIEAHHYPSNYSRMSYSVIIVLPRYIKIREIICRIFRFVQVSVYVAGCYALAPIPAADRLHVLCIGRPKTLSRGTCPPAPYIFLRKLCRPTWGVLRRPTLPSADVFVAPTRTAIMGRHSFSVFGPKPGMGRSVMPKAIIRILLCTASVCG